MAIPVNELRNGVVFQDSTGVWQVESYSHVKMGRGNAVIKIKAKNLRSGSIAEKSFASGGKVDQAEAEKRKLQYLYQDPDNFFFMDPESFDQMSLAKNKSPDLAKFIKEGESVEVLMIASEPVSAELPNNVTLVVSEADPGERGNSVSNLLKSCTTETGLLVHVPLFIKPGDKIKVDTRSSAYIERV